MTRAETVDPQVQALLDMMDQQGVPPTHSLSVEEARERLKALFETEDPTPVEGGVDDFEIEGPGGAIPIRAYDPGGEGPHPVLVFYHGGGWTLGDIEAYDEVCRALTNRAEVMVLSVDYRLAPEHEFPAAVADAYAALEWAAEYAGELGGDPDRLAVGGDSAGGNLSAAVTLLARDEDGPAIDHQLLIYPAVASPDLHEFDSVEQNAEGYFLERESVAWFYGKYAPDRLDRRNEYLAPLLAGDYEGLPPATVVTAGFDPLRDEGMAYADQLEADGVPVTHRNFDAMIHGFVSLREMVDRADEAVDFLADELAATWD